MSRVVSLVPSVTESLLRWGVAPVAVTRFCEAPGIPTVGGTKNPDVAAIVALQPDVVIMDKEENRAVDADSLTSAGVQVTVTAVRSIDDVPAALAVIAGAAGLTAVPEPPPRAPVPLPGRRLSVFVPIWRRPWMTVGGSTYGSTLLSAAALDNIFASSADPYPTIDLAEACARRPDVVLAPSEPYEFKEKHRAELEEVAPVVFVEGRDLFWWGTRSPAALDRLREMAGGLAGE
ncbi:MAG TPA: helical backbone metal receptor [Acidimicrobiales bacterium]|nr:helical backbone metal receptor [Acidimicrobiales bacterium]